MLNHILHKQNPLYLFHIQLFPYRFFKWGALFLALLSTYRIVVAFRRKAHSKPLLRSNDDDDDDDYDFSDTDDDSDDETVSTSDSEDDNLEGEEEDDDKAKDRRGKGAYFQN
ncbi:hypothetical protein RIF29_22512 [Crotalaria pallida]|uniref:Uncharacterized protein n=1 Tax=Crotalaria pallida TaxID=3830 RepID=A0AAN9F8Z3_CROPI